MKFKCLIFDISTFNSMHLFQLFFSLIIPSRKNISSWWIKNATKVLIPSSFLSKCLPRSSDKFGKSVNIRGYQIRGRQGWERASKPRSTGAATTACGGWEGALSWSKIPALSVPLRFSWYSPSFRLISIVIPSDGLTSLSTACRCCLNFFGGREPWCFTALFALFDSGSK